MVASTSSPWRILIADSRDGLTHITRLLHQEGIPVSEIHDPSIRDLLPDNDGDLAIVEIHVAGLDPCAFLLEAAQLPQTQPIFLVTGFGNLPTVVLTRTHVPLRDTGPLDSHELVQALRRARDKQYPRASPQTPKKDALAWLASEVAHDFNNLLTLIQGNCALLLRDTRSDSSFSPVLREIQHATDQAALLSHQLLAFSRNQFVPPRVLDVNMLVLDLAEMLRRRMGEKIAVHTELEMLPCLVKISPGSLERALLNLAINARDAMPQGGRFTIATQVVMVYRGVSGGVVIGGGSQPSGDPLTPHPAPPPGAYVRISVGDTGTGMNEEVKARIFQPFFTTKGPGKGSGLGLSAVRTMIEECAGHIDVDSVAGQGTTFQLYVPLMHHEAEPLDRPCALSPEPGSETVLVVEDEDRVRVLVRQILQGKGYHVLEAAHSKEALFISQQFQQPIHLLITDLALPHMNGQELASRLVPAHPEIKVLFISGYNDSIVAQLDDWAKTNAFLQKPFTPDDLARKVREVLDHRPAA